MCLWPQPLSNQLQTRIFRRELVQFRLTQGAYVQLISTYYNSTGIGNLCKIQLLDLWLAHRQYVVPVRFSYSLLAQ